MIIGTKENFGIEFNLIETNTPERNYGHVVLFLGNHVLGYYDDPISIDAVNYQLSRLVANQNVFFDSLMEFSSEEAYQEMVDSHDVKYDSCLLSLGESFDDFDLKYFKSNNEVRFIWRLYEDHVFSYDIKDYDVHGYDVHIDDVLIVQKRLEQVLEK